MTHKTLLYAISGYSVFSACLFILLIALLLYAVQIMPPPYQPQPALLLPPLR